MRSMVCSVYPCVVRYAHVLFRIYVIHFDKNCKVYDSTWSHILIVVNYKLIAGNYILIAVNFNCVYIVPDTGGFYLCFRVHVVG